MLNLLPAEVHPRQAFFRGVIVLKRVISLFLCIFMAAGLFGCAGNGSKETAGAAEPIEDIYPDMAYSVWETDVLKSEPGNYDRSARVSDGEWAETATGYYLYVNNQLLYSDKIDPGNWVPLCSKPDCDHKTCSAYISNGVCFANERIYFLRDAKTVTEYTGKKSGYILCSVAMDGTDQRMEYVWEEGMLSSGGSVCAILSQNGLAYGSRQLQLDGSYLKQLLFADAEGAKCVYSQMESAESQGSGVYVSNKFISLSGDFSVVTDYLKFDSSAYSTIIWEEDGQLYNADLSEFPHFCAYFFDGNLRFFRTNDGYYDVDLTTMEEVKLCDAQLENSGMRILQANCVLESNLFQQNTFDPYDRNYTELPRVGEGVLRLFNGQQWLEVELPEELKNLPEGTYLFAQTLTSEHIIFMARVDDAQRYYRIDLAAENLKLEYWFETK